MPIAAGTHYFLHEAGSVMRPPLVLLHDAGGDHLSWPAEIRLLARTRVYTLDLPGHGKTEGLGRQYIEDYARCVAEFMTAAGLSRAVIGGHGMGGAIALRMALEQPERVAGIVLLSTGPRLPIPGIVMENGASSSTMVQAVHILQGMSFHPKTPALLRDSACRKMLKVRHTLLYGDWQACDRFNMNGRIDSIRTPALVICGMDDKLTPVNFSETLASQIPGAALQTVAEAGHMVLLEQPRHIAKLIGVFLNTIPYMPGM